MPLVTRSVNIDRGPTLWVVAPCSGPRSESLYECVAHVAAIAAPQANISFIRRSTSHHKIRSGSLFRRTGCYVSRFTELLRLVKKGDTILAITVPPGAPIWVAVAALLRGGSYIYFWVADDEAAAKAADSSGSAIGRPREYVRRWALKHVAGVIVNTREQMRLAIEITEGLNIPVRLVDDRPAEVEFSVDSGFLPLMQ